ncbi:choline kinase family protein [Xenorhabdus griffiniae]|uniref:choline kinase family protein n=1 Tax=Xenorhabdus griffiniae TaxID=351672 RepID=UPI0023589FA4|nr:choline kinase family protein [Xenorhabdus griffiniae]MDC9603971.1 choline kinase family protein [Xenorhabdus griffiniae]
MTNTNYLIFIDNKEMVLRIPGKATENFINRYNEKTNSELMSSLGINVNVLYFDHHTGIKITKYIKNSSALSPKTAKSKDNILLISHKLSELHKSDFKFNNHFNVFNEFNHYWSLLKNKIIPYSFEQKEEVIQFFLQSEEILNTLGIECCPCHNDLVAENILKFDDNIYIIDWEYSGMNDPMFDIAALFLECNYSPEEQIEFLSNYFKEKIDANTLKKILLFQFTQDVLWTIWTMVKEENGENFGNYGINRLMRAYKTMQTYKLNYA